MAEGEAQPAAHEWSCPSCTLFNSKNNNQCEACGTPQPGVFLNNQFVPNNLPDPNPYNNLPNPNPYNNLPNPNPYQSIQPGQFYPNYNHSHPQSRFNPSLCSYSQFGPRFIAQNRYRCFTCNYNYDQMCCENCAFNCHQGHDLKNLGEGMGFCGCGAMGPQCNIITNKPIISQNPYNINLSNNSKPLSINISCLPPEEFDDYDNCCAKMTCCACCIAILSMFCMS